MRLIYNSDAQRLQKNFDDKTPITVSELFRSERTASVPIELFLIDNDGGYATPGTSDYEVLIGRQAQAITTGKLTLTFTGTTEEIDLSKPKLATRIEAALNVVSEVNAAGGVDVVELKNGRAFQITFRSVGSRAAITAGVKDSMQPASVIISEVTAGTGSTREVQLLTLEEASLAEISTSGWSANSNPALAISTLVEGTANTREVVQLSVTGDPAPGSFFVVSNSEPISTEATAAQVKTILNSALSSDIGSVKKTGERIWQITYKTNGDKTALSAGTHNLVKRPSVTGTLSLNTTALAYAANSDGSDLSVGFTLKKSNEVLLSENVDLAEPFAEVIGSSAMLNNDSLGALFTIGGDDVNKGTAISLSGGLTYSSDTLAAPFLPLAGGTMTGNAVFNDGVKAIFGTASDGIELYHQSNHSYLADTGTGALKILGSQIEINNAANSENIATFTQDGGAALFFNNSKKIESTNLGCTISGKLIVNGDLDVSGTTTTFNSTVVTVDDPVFGIGGDSAPGSDDNKDRGIEFRYYSGSAKIGFFGYDDSEDAFTFLTDATNNSEVFSGTLGNIKVGSITGSNFYATQIRTENGSASFPSHSFTNDSDSGMFRPTANNIAITAGGSEVIRFDDNLKTTTKGSVRVNGSTTEGIVIASSSSASQGLKIFNNSSTDDASIINHYSGNLIFGTANTEAARFNSSGTLEIKDSIKFEANSYSQGTGTIGLLTNDILYIRGGANGTLIQDNDGTESIRVGSGYINANVGSINSRFTSTGFGVGTASPASMLQCTTVDAVNTFTMHRDGSNNGTNTALNRIQFAQDYDGTQSDFGRIDLTSNASSLRTDLKFYVKSTAGTEKLGLNIHGTVDQGARVGVGDVAIPSTLLHVSNGASGFSGSYNARTQAIIESDSASGTALAIMAKNTGSSAIWFGDQDGETVGQVGYNHTNNTLNFATEGATQAILTSTGLGIGGTPSELLDVHGAESKIKLTSTSHSRDTIFQQGGGHFHIKTSHANGVAINNGSSSAGQLGIYNSSTESIRLAANGDSYFNGGNVGIGGVTSPSAKLDIQLEAGAWSVGSAFSNQAVRISGGSGGLGLAYDDTTGATIAAIHHGNAYKVINFDGASYKFNINSSEKMRLDSTGLGIGVTPSAFLHVSKDNDNSGNQFCVADTEGTSAAVRTYTHDGDAQGLILNHYYAVAGSGNEYMRYADFVSNVGNGAGTSMRFITKNAANSYSSTIIDNEGRLGIGGTPSVKTHIKDTSAGAGVVLRIENDGASGAAQLDLKNDVQSWLINTRTDDHFSVYNNTSATTPFLINTSGNVGIGTTSPSGTTTIHSALDCSSDFGTHNKYALNLHNLADDTNESIGISFGLSSSSTAVGAAIAHERKGSSSYGDLYFLTRSSSAGIAERMRIDSSGNVGIGTTSPDSLLTVQKNTTVGPSIALHNSEYQTWINNWGSTASSGRQSRFEINAGTTDFAVGGATIRFQIGNVGDSYEKMRIHSNGNVGIGTTSPQANLHIFKTEGSVGDKHATIRLGGYLTTGAEISAYRVDGNSNNQGLMFSSHDATDGVVERMRIDSTGDVEIVTDGKGLILSSPDGTRYKITVANGGAVTSTAM